MLSKLLMATHNQGKATELRDLLANFPIQILTLADFPEVSALEETGTTFLENALQKANAAAEISGLPTLADDSGLKVDALQGQPGVYSARFAGEPGNDEQNNLKLLQLMEGILPAQRTARFVSVIVLVLPQGQVYSTEGHCEGLILESLRGTGGFGYDPLFYVPELGKTMAELTLEEKNMVSHRAKALKRMVPQLQELCPKTT